jgi:hypothetical protein
MTTPLVLYIIGAVLLLVGETVAAILKIKGATLSEYVKEWRREVIAVWYVVPWLAFHFLFAGEPRAGEHTLMIVVSSVLLILSIATRLLGLSPDWRNKLIFAMLGAFAGFLTPIP